MVVKVDGAGALAGSSGNSRSSSGSYPVLSSIKRPANGRNVSPAEPLNIPIAPPKASVPAPAQLQQPWQGPNVGTVPWQGSQDYNQQQAQAPMPAPEPIQQGPIAGGREWYGALGADAKQNIDQQWLAGDSDYTAQIAEYDKALKSFVDRIANQRKMFDEDASLATASTGRNQEMSLDNLGEDFGARGLSYSGMFDTSKNETNTRFNEAKAGIERIRSKNNTDANNRESDYKAENAISRKNAERGSLNRQAQRQALIDSGAF